MPGACRRTPIPASDDSTATGAKPGCRGGILGAQPPRVLPERRAQPRAHRARGVQHIDGVFAVEREISDLMRRRVAPSARRGSARSSARNLPAREARLGVVKSEIAKAIDFVALTRAAAELHHVYPIETASFNASPGLACPGLPTSYDASPSGSLTKRLRKNWKPQPPPEPAVFAGCLRSHAHTRASTGLRDAVEPLAQP
jgi:hypothetical protein